MGINISPIFYQGCKKKLIKKGLIDLFPKNIDTFYDFFGGSGIVAMNVKANNYVINDIDKNLFSLYRMFKIKTETEILTRISNLIDLWELQKDNVCYDSRNKNFDKEAFEEHKKTYSKFRKFYNETSRDVIDFYILTIYCFSHQLRFNSKNEFNMPCGHDKFTKDNQLWIKKGCDFFAQPNVKICDNDAIAFAESETIYLIDQRNPVLDCFMYFDPPYLNTTATYNENNA